VHCRTSVVGAVPARAAHGARWAAVRRGLCGVDQRGWHRRGLGRRAWAHCRSDRRRPRTHPFITQAERVVILTIDEDSEPDDRSAERLRHSLRWHNPYVMMHRLVRDHGVSGRDVPSGCARVRSVLLVMGGYGHTTLHEAVFGGFTRHVLERAELPVLTAH
jgi:nucleotide-binding universal stress UspA family protein